MHNVLVRHATEADMEAVARIYGHYVRHGVVSFEIVPPEAAEMARRRAEILKRGLPFVVAETGGVVAGYAYVSLYRPRRAYRFTVEDSIYIDVEHRRKGIGKLLLQSIVESAEALGYRQMIAVIGGSDNLASIGLHQSLGFRHAATLESVGFKFGRWVDSVLMQRPLGLGNSTLPVE